LKHLRALPPPPAGGPNPTTAAHYRTPGASQCGKDLVGRHLADQQEQRGIAGLQRPRRLPHKVVVDAEIGQLSAERAGSSTKCAPASGIMNNRPISEPHNTPETAPRAIGWNSWFSLTRPLVSFTAMTASPSSIRYSFLHREQHLTHAFGLFFAREFDDKQIRHSRILHSL
jgi:hypothetical protein